MTKYKQLGRFFIGIIIFAMTFILGPRIVNAETYIVSAENINDLQRKVDSLAPGDKLLLSDGEYRDLKLIINNSGEKDNPIVIKAINSGEVIFSGDSKVEIRGSHIVLDE